MDTNDLEQLELVVETRKMEISPRHLPALSCPLPIMSKK